MKTSMLWILLVIVLFVVHCFMAKILSSMIYTMFYINSVQFERDVVIYAKEQEIQRLEKEIQIEEIPEYKAYLESKLAEIVGQAKAIIEK